MNKVPQFLTKNGKIYQFVSAQSEFFLPEDQPLLYYENGCGDEIVIEKTKIGTEYKVLKVKNIKTFNIKAPTKSAI